MTTVFCAAFTTTTDDLRDFLTAYTDCQCQQLVKRAPLNKLAVIWDDLFLTLKALLLGMAQEPYV